VAKCVRFQVPRQIHITISWCIMNSLSDTRIDCGHRSFFSLCICNQSAKFDAKILWINAWRAMWKMVLGCKGPSDPVKINRPIICFVRRDWTRVSEIRCAQPRPISIGLLRDFIWNKNTGRKSYISVCEKNS
jgi:hypothetical protein